MINFKKSTGKIGKVKKDYGINLETVINKNLEIDDTDLVSYHMYYKDKDGIQAYLRVIPANVTMDDVSIGRVISIKRRSGLGSKLLKAGKELAIEKFNAKKISLEAQVYAKHFYELQGFKQVSNEFLEDDIPHIKMTWEE